MSKNRFTKALSIIRHKHAMYLLWSWQGGYEGTNVPYVKVLCHDLSKIFSTVVLGEKLTKKYHKNKRHHLCLEIDAYPDMCLNGDGLFIGDKLTEWFSEAYLDWACSRMTKSDKQLDAVQTAEQVHKGFVRVSKAYFEKYGYK